MCGSPGVLLTAQLYVSQFPTEWALPLILRSPTKTGGVGRIAGVIREGPGSSCKTAWNLWLHWTQEAVAPASRACLPQECCLLLHLQYYWSLSFPRPYPVHSLWGQGLLTRYMTLPGPTRFDPSRQRTMIQTVTLLQLFRALKDIESIYLYPKADKQLCHLLKTGKWALYYTMPEQL